MEKVNILIRCEAEGVVWLWVIGGTFKDCDGQVNFRGRDQTNNGGG